VISDKSVAGKKKAAFKESVFPYRRFWRGRNLVRTAEFLDYLRQAVASIVAHKLRVDALDTGHPDRVAAVISMIAIGEARKSPSRRA